MMTVLDLFYICLFFSFSKGHSHDEPRDPECFVGAVVSDPKYPKESQLVFKRSKLVQASGHSVSLFNDIVFALNLKSHIVQGTGWGSKLGDNNTSWDGALGQLQSGEIDIFASQATFLSEKAQDFRLMPPTFKGQYYVYFRTPRGVAYEKVFTRSFSKTVWFAIIAVFVIIAICTWWLSNCRGAASDPTYSASDVLISCFAMFTEQGIPFMPIKTSLRISLIVTSSCVVVISTAYSAQLVSIFSLHETGIRSFSDVQKRLVLKGDSATPFVQDLVYGIKKSHLHRPEFLIDTNLAVQRVMKSRTAFLTFEGFPLAVMTQANLSFNQYCNEVTRVKALNTIRWSGMAMRKDHPRTEKVSQTLIKILERGLNYRYEKNAENLNCNREPKLEHPHIEIAIDSILVLLFTLLAAYVGSFSLFLCEYKRNVKHLPFPYVE